MKEAASHEVKGSLYSCLLIVHLPSGSRMLNWHLETIYTYMYIAYPHLSHSRGENQLIFLPSALLLMLNTFAAHR